MVLRLRCQPQLLSRSLVESQWMHSLEDQLLGPCIHSQIVSRMLQSAFHSRDVPRLPVAGKTPLAPGRHSTRSDPLLATPRAPLVDWTATLLSHPSRIAQHAQRVTFPLSKIRQSCLNYQRWKGSSRSVSLSLNIHLCLSLCVPSHLISSREGARYARTSLRLWHSQRTEDDREQLLRKRSADCLRGREGWRAS